MCSSDLGEALRDLDGAQCVAWVPAYPVDLADRERFADLVAAAAGPRWAPAAKGRA